MELGPRVVLGCADTWSRLTRNCTPWSPTKLGSACCVLALHGLSQLVPLGYRAVGGEVESCSGRNRLCRRNKEICAQVLCSLTNICNGNTEDDPTVTMAGHLGDHKKWFHCGLEGPFLKWGKSCLVKEKCALLPPTQRLIFEVLKLGTKVRNPI